MKTLIPLTALAALLASGSLPAQTPAYSKPSGYMAQKLATGFNLVGISLHPSPAATGIVTALSDKTLTASALSFTPQATSLYFLEITSGNGKGILQEVATSGFNVGGVITVVDDLRLKVSVGDAFTLRRLPTLEDLFGTTSSILTKGGSAGSSDIIWLPNGSGGFNRYFLNSSNSWRNAVSGGAPNIPVRYTDGLFVQRRGASVDFLTTGQVKTDATTINISTGFNLVGTVFPAGSTLQNLGLESSLKSGGSAGASDIIWVPNPTAPGGYNRYFYNSSNQWRNAVSGPAPADLPITTAIFVQRRDGAKDFTLTPPLSYTNL